VRTSTHYKALQASLHADWETAEIVATMQIEKIALEKAARALLKKAADCLEVANSQKSLANNAHEIAAGQRKNADQQHDLAAKQDVNATKLDSNAKKLKTLGHALEADAAETQGDTLVTQRGRP
jgi:hypothetical protein